MVHYRTFRNTDPPGLAEVWNESLRGRGAVPLANSSPLEHLIFAKPYFDPAGLILAWDGDTLVGFGHAGFGVKADESELVKPKAFVVLKEGYAASPELEAELIEFARENMAGYKRPRWVEFVPDLPYTATGKIQRFKLRE